MLVGRKWSLQVGHRQLAVVGRVRRGEGTGTVLLAGQRWSLQVVNQTFFMIAVMRLAWISTWHSRMIVNVDMHDNMCV